MASIPAPGDYDPHAHSLEANLDFLFQMEQRLMPGREAEAMENVYTLPEGPGLQITDRVNGIVKITFRGMSTDSRPEYDLTLNGKQLIHPASSPSGDIKFSLIGSRTITIARQDRFIKIIEVDETSTNEFWIDNYKPPVEGRAYDVYSYQPKAVTLEEAISKINKLVKSCPNFKPEFMVYNRHGVAVVGEEQVKEVADYALFWANPHQAEMRKIECFHLWRPGQFRDGGSASAKASDGSVYFRRQPVCSTTAPGFNYYLNAEPATEFVLSQSCAAGKPADPVQVDPKRKTSEDRPDLISHTQAAAEAEHDAPYAPLPDAPDDFAVNPFA